MVAERERRERREGGEEKEMREEMIDMYKEIKLFLVCHLAEGKCTRG